jgi:hypothetical protein
MARKIPENILCAMWLTGDIATQQITFRDAIQVASPRAILEIGERDRCGREAIVLV